MNEASSEQEKHPQGTLICPLLSMRPKTLDTSVRQLVSAGDPNECLHEKCAWWNAERQQCALLVLSSR